MALKKQTNKQTPAGTMLRQHHMLKRVLNSGRERRAEGLFICLVSLELTRYKVERREKRTKKYIYIKFYK